MSLPACCGPSRKRQWDHLSLSAVQRTDPVPSTSCSQVVSLETFVAQRWTSLTWKALFPALCEDLKGFIKSSLLTLQSYCMLEIVASTVFSIMHLIYICKMLLLILGSVFGN